jgi:eukaryotic-like serine/threonine-protein kinase
VNKLGKYELIQELGRGAMGIVYRARDPIINRLVALKTITKGVAEDPNMLQRFYREAQSAGGLQHPNIVTIYDMGEEAGTPYIAMELVEGESLEQLIGSRPDLPLSLKLTYAIQACRAFDYAHKRGIIHRDIKPANVMLSKDGVVKVVDFGIARVVKTSKTQTGMLIGTFAYMAPEQYHGEHADERSDLWSFGVLLYELVSYQRPFRGDAPAILMHGICDQDFEPLCAVCPESPPELEAVLSRVLQKSPIDRYQSMEDLLLELDPICKSLQSATVAKLVEHGHELVRQGDFPQARDILRQALQVESTNTQARSLLDKVNTELRRILIRPKAQEMVEKGRALLEQGRIQEARGESESALRLDPSFEPAQELQQLVQRESDRSQLVSQYLEASKLRLAEGLPEEAESLLDKVAEIEPSNKLASALRQQVVKEKAQRDRRIRFLDTMRQARSLWTLQKYSDCIRLLSDLQEEFPGEEEILRLLETARDEEAEQGRRQSLEKARSLLAAGRHQESIASLLELQKQFPADNEIAILMDEAHADQASQRRLQGLGEARRLLAGRRCDECITLLTRLQQEFPNETEIAKLLEAAREAELNQRRQQHVAKARKLLVARRYEECNLVLADLRKRFPQDQEIADLISAVREEQSEQRKAHSLAEARNLVAASHYEEAIVLLAKVQQEHPEDDEVARTIATVRSDQAEQRKLQVLTSARSLLAQRRYKECIELVADLRKSYPHEDEIKKLLDTAIRDQAEQQRQEKLAKARGFLAAGRLGDAQALLDTLRAADPKNQSVLKLLALVQGEQEKQGKAERQRQEWTVLKELVDGKKYAEVIERAEKLRKDFPNDVDLARLVEFARTQQSQVERESLLGKACERVKSHLAANRFQEAVQAAQQALKTFPGNKDLLLLQQQTELQDRKFQTRKAIEQRIRDIKVRINREKFSEAIELAKQTLVTLGPDPAVTQLLTSAEVESKARENKRKQEKELETIRTLVDDGKLPDATQALQTALETNVLDSFDPRVGRISDDIKSAGDRSSAPSRPGPEPPPQGPGISKEYAWQMGPPVLPDVAEANTQTQMSPATQVSFQPHVLSGPPAAPPAPPVVPTSVPVIKVPAEVPAAPKAEPPKPRVSQPSPSQPSAVKPAVPEQPPARSVEPPAIAKPSQPPRTRTIAPATPRTSKPVFSPPAVERRPQVAEIPYWKRPTVVAIAAISLIVIWGGVHLVNKGGGGMVVRAPDRTPGGAPPVNPLELRQRQALAAADKSRAAGDLAGASRAVQDASLLNGPLSSEIRKKQDAIQAEMSDESLRKVRQQEEQLWQQAMSDVDHVRFDSARVTLDKIAKQPVGQGLRREDAQKYLTQIIPQRQHEEELLAKANLDLRKKDRGSLNDALGVLGQIIQNGGPRKPEAERLRQNAQDALSTLDKQQRDQKIVSLQEMARQLIKQGDISSARTKADEIKRAGGDASELSTEIERAAAAQKSAEQYEASYQQLVQKYQQVPADDKNGLEGALAAFQPIAQGGGPRALQANQYINEINTKLTSLRANEAKASAAVNKPVAPPAPPATKPDLPSAKALDEAAVRDVIKRYALAFQQRDADAVLQIRPNIGNSGYRKLKSTFEQLAELDYQVDISEVQVSASGDQATVNGSLTQSSTVKRGDKGKPRKDPVAFDLTKSNGKWVVTGVR